MASRTKSFSPRTGTRAVRQSVGLPAPLAAEVRRESLKTAYRRFLKEQEPSKKEDAGQDLLRAIFWKDASTEDLIL